MKIKTTKQMRLDELIKYIDGNEEAKGKYFFPTPLRGVVKVTDSGQVNIEGVYLDDTFAVEVEEELTEETVFDELADLHFNNEVGKLCLVYHHNSSISKITAATMKIFTSSAIYHKDTLIWSRDTGIPAEGVIECS